jgi:hypothetical protein
VGFDAVFTSNQGPKLARYSCRNEDDANAAMDLSCVCVLARVYAEQVCIIDAKVERL